MRKKKAFSDKRLIQFESIIEEPSFEEQESGLLTPKQSVNIEF